VRADAGRIDTRYPEDSFPGHAAWLDWPWKLHRIQGDDGVRFELYNLADDPQETRDLATEQDGKAGELKPPLEAWLTSVVHSLNGDDY
jgi:hypothetical protein